MVYLLIVCRTLLVGVFVAALAGKAARRAAYRDFATWVGTLGLVPRRLTAAAAAGATAAEVAAVALLALPATVPVGFALAVALLAVFTAGVVLAIRRGRRAPCHCFGASRTPLGAVHVVRNAMLLAVGCAGLTLSVVGDPDPATHLAGVLLAVTVALLALLPVLRLDDLMALFTTRSEISYR